MKELTRIAPYTLVCSLFMCIVFPPQVGRAGQDPLPAFLKHPAIQGARVGVVLEDLESGRRLLGHQAERTQVPASNQKLMLAAAVLAHWGPTYRFETPIYVEGPQHDEVLQGRLWVVGQGDPTLVSESFWKIAEEVRLRGITEIRGGIGVDQSHFDAVSIHPDWQPTSSRAYNAPTAAFAANYSSFRVEVRPGVAVGKKARVDVAPVVPYFRTLSDALTVRGKGRLQLGIERLSDGSGEQVHIAGAVGATSKPKTYWRSVADPGRYAAALFRAQLEAHGVSVQGGTEFGPLPGDARELLSYEGDPLSVSVNRLNKYSNNFIAEQLTKGLGAARYGAPGTWDKGTRAIEEYLSDAGLLDERAVIADGSGLSARNRVAPATLAGVIRTAARRFDTGPEFLASLPLGGLDGTLADRMDGEEGTVRGKTGHLNRVSSLSGIIPSAQGRRLVFSILVNGARGSSSQVDDAIDALVAGMSSFEVQPDEMKPAPAAPPTAVPEQGQEASASPTPAAP